MQGRYDWVFDETTNKYRFLTKNDVLYRVVFVADETFSSIAGEEIPNVFQIVVEKASEGIEPFDLNVSRTIEELVALFFQKVENSLLYVCYDLDEKAAIRYAVFERWYKNSRSRKNVVKIDKVIEIPLADLSVQKLYTAFLFHRQNPDYEKLLRVYDQMEKALRSDK